MRVSVRLVLFLAMILTTKGAAAQQATVALESEDADRLTPMLDRPARLNLQQGTLSTALNRLSQTSGVPLAFSPSLVGAETRHVRCDCDSMTVRQALDHLLQDTKFGYRELRGEVLIFQDLPAAEPPVLSPPPATLASLGMMTVGAADSDGSGTEALSQQVGTIRGVVRDASTREPMQGVHIQLQGTTISALSSATGTYVLADVPVGTYVVTAKHIGYVDERRAGVRVAGDSVTTVDFELRSDAIRLSELVVTGLSNPVEGRQLPFVVNKLGGEELEAVPSPHSAIAALQGRVPGLMITNSDGRPGSEIRIELRTPTTIFGSESPLFVVDGVILGTGVEAAQDIESLDIESIEVVKGAAGAALYGSTAAAGVIHITTRRGRDLPIGPARIQARTEYGFSQLANTRPTLARHHVYNINKGEEYIDANGDLVRPGDFIQRDGTLAKNYNQWVFDLRDVMEHTYNSKLYDHIDALFQPDRFLTNNVTISQNLGQTNYRIGLQHYHEAGALRESDGFQRYTGRLNFDHRFGDRLQVSVGVQHVRSTRDDGDNIVFTRLMNYSPIVNLLKKDSAGNYLQFPDPGYAFENPVWRAGTRDNWTKTERTLLSSTVRFTPFHWLTLNGSLGYDRNNINAQIFEPMGIPQRPDDTDPTDGLLRYTASERDALNGQLAATFAQRFGKLNPRLTLSGTFRSNVYKSFYAEARNYVVGGLKGFNLAADKSRMGNSHSEERANGVLADLAVDYDAKYILSAVLHRDGSSRFGPESRWHTYYALRGAYRMAEEPWWPAKSVITEFKPRIALGTAGGRPTFAQQYETWSVSIPVGGSPVFTRGTAGNPELAPEYTVERELGVDLTLFRNHDFRVTFVRQVTDNLILKAVGPGAEGYFEKWQNMGEQSGKTFELEYIGRLINKPRFSWTLGMVVDRSNSWISRWDVPSYPQVNKFYGPGASLYDFWGRRFLRSTDELLAKAGVPVEYHNQFDVNDDGYVVWVGEGKTWKDGWDGGEDGAQLWGTRTTINGITYQWGMPVVEREPNGDIAFRKIGTSMPDFNFGITNSFRYKGLSLHMHLRGQVGGNVYSRGKQILYSGRMHGDLVQVGKPEYAKKPVAYYRDAAGLIQGSTSVYTSHFVDDGTYLTLNTLGIQYQFTQGQLARVFGNAAPSNLRLSLNGRNLYTWAGDYDGWNPAAGAPHNRVDTSSSYPQLRHWTMAVEVNF